MFDGDLGTALVASARRHAERPALWARGTRLTYRELFERAAGWAAAMRAAGLARGERVCVLSNRSATAYAGILAALLAGATYVPLNARFPRERNRAIFAAADPAALILDDENRVHLDSLLGDGPRAPLVVAPESGPLPASTGRRVLTASDLPGVALEKFDGGADPNAPAYLLFTSGTTGVPKGVPIDHRNVAAYMSAMHRLLPLGAEDRVLQSSDLTFDQSVHDMFLTWLSGAELYATPPDASIMAPRFIAEFGLTACHFVPSIATRAFDRGLLKPGGMPTLRYTAFGGEALPVAIVRPWAEAAPNSAIFNFYGPTEGTVYFSSYRLDPDRPLDMAVAPVGRPLGEQRIALFDGDGREVAKGETGEIHLAGSQLMRGYWRAPDLDAAKFTEIGGVRWYKTGDLGRIVDDYGIVFAGRVDRQAKIRGYRVELQEIEGAVRKVSAREQVAVIAWPPSDNGVADTCIAFVVAPEGDADAVRAGCRAVLPSYMVPSDVLFVAELPLNQNGKVDYAALSRHDALQGLTFRQ